MGARLRWAGVHNNDGGSHADNCTWQLLITSTKVEVMRLGQFVSSFCPCAASCKKLIVCMDLHEIFNNGRSWPSLKQVSFWRWSRLTFTVNVTVTVAQQSHFGIKLTSTETVRVRYSQSYHRLHSTLTKSRMCSVQWHHPWWPWARFKVKPRDDMFLRGKLSPQWNLFVAAAANNSVHLFHPPPR